MDPWGSAAEFDRDRNRLSLSGEWDIAEKTRLGELFELLQTKPEPHLDLRCVTFIDSSVLTQIARAAKRFQGNGARLHVDIASPSIARVFQISGVAKLVDVETLEPKR